MPNDLMIRAIETATHVVYVGNDRETIEYLAATAKPGRAAIAVVDKEHLPDELIRLETGHFSIFTLQRDHAMAAIAADFATDLAILVVSDYLSLGLLRKMRVFDSDVVAVFKNEPAPGTREAQHWAEVLSFFECREQVDNVRLLYPK